MSRPEFQSLCGLLVAALVVAGCGSRGGTLAGRVLVDGEPLANGILMVQAANGSQLSSPVVAGGYEVREVPLGPARLAVRSLPPPPMIGPPPTSPANGGAAAAGGTFKPLPDDYADPERSGLEATMTGRWQRHDLQLSSAGN